MEEVKPDPARIHFTGRIPHGQLLSLFQVSSLHVYLIYPFVLGWSMLEAMSCGVPVIGSKTPPVQEVISDGENGILFDFFDTDGLVHHIDDLLCVPEKAEQIGRIGREHIRRHYDLKTKCLPRQVALLRKHALSG